MRRRRRPPPPGLFPVLVGVLRPGLGVAGAPLQHLLGHGLPEFDAAGLGRPFGDVVEGVVERRVELAEPARVKLGERAVRGDRGRGFWVRTGGRAQGGVKRAVLAFEKRHHVVHRDVDDREIPRRDRRGRALRLHRRERRLVPPGDSVGWRRTREGGRRLRENARAGREQEDETEQAHDKVCRECRMCGHYPSSPCGPVPPARSGTRPPSDGGRALICTGCARCRGVRVTSSARAAARRARR